MNSLSKLEAIFFAALENRSSQDRATFLDKECSGDVDLRQRVEKMLVAQASAGSFLEAPPSAINVEPAPTLDQPPSEQPGTLIGPYKLLEQIGEGGMGLVYMAEQQRPMRRLVALKLIKPGMDSKQVIARFEAEKQALAMMDHENIAKVFEAGTTDTGRFYFAMELVRGIPINEFCDQKRLSVRERLALFIQVCQAVQHAHQKGIIHRDLKPSNVLVTMHDVLAVPKVIDFGIAKALGQQLTEHTLHTGFAQLVGTPLYMSPEQAEMNQLGVDTRSDVYSLAVLLYELLTGTTPFDKETLSKAGLDEMRRMIREDDPLRPSARISTLQAPALSTISQRRNTDPRRISATLRGELDWIVMKALEKDRSRRYESASALATDIQRYLSDEPVLACPPTTMYRFQKFARKHKPALATATAIALCLLLGTTVSAWQAVRATTAEEQANVNEAHAKANAQEAKEKAKEATTQRDEAQRQRDEVKALYERLQATQAELRSTLYASNMNLARHAWDANDAGRLQTLLAQHRSKPGETDLRGFEWHYLYRQSHSEILNLKISGRSVAYSPDGKRLASVGDAIRIVDAQTGRLLLTFKGGGGGGDWCNSVAFSPDGKRLAASAGFGTAQGKVWDAETGQELLTLKAASFTVAFSPDGKRVASAGWAFPADGGFPNCQVNLWDAESGQQVFSIKSTTRIAGSMAFRPDGKHLACGTKVFDAQTGEELFDLKQTGNTCVSYSPDGKRLASAAGRALKVWDAQNGQELLTIQAIPDGVTNVAYSPDGKRLAGACNDRTVRTWDAQTGQEVFAIKGTGRVNGVTFSPDGARLVTNGDTVQIWDAQNDQRPLTLKASDTSDVASVAYSPDGKRLASSVRESSTAPAPLGQVKIWDAQAGKELFTLKVGNTGRLGSVAYSPDGKLLATDGETLKIWDALTGHELLSLAHDNHDYRGNDSLAFSPDGMRVASCSGLGGGRGPGYVKVWNARTGQELLSIDDKNHVLSITFSPDGKRLAGGTRFVAQGASNTKVWDAATGQELLVIKGLALRHLKFSPDGKRLAGSDYVYGNVRVLDAQTGQELLKLPTGSNGLAFSHDGKRIVSAAGDKTVRVWDSQTGQELFTVEGHRGDNGVAFSPDGNRLACGGADGTLKIYDATPLPEKR